MILYYSPTLSEGPIINILILLIFIFTIPLWLFHHCGGMLIRYNNKRIYNKLNNITKSTNLEIEKSMSKTLNNILDNAEKELEFSIPRKLRKEIYYNCEILKIESFLIKEKKRLKKEEIQKIAFLMYNIHTVYIREEIYYAIEYNKSTEEIWEEIFEKTKHDFSSWM